MNLSKKHSGILSIFLGIASAAFVVAIFVLLRDVTSSQDEAVSQNETERSETVEGCDFFKKHNLATNSCKTSIDLDLVLSGGPGKDGIPAINNPEFEPYDQSEMPENARGILIDIDDVQRFYPYNILVWHEIINDSINDTHFAITFCPLCDSGIVMNRSVGNEILQFGVSGLLYQSNLLMYDTKTESLWSQVRREAVIGQYQDTKLDILPFQLLTFDNVRKNYPQGKILSTQTGFSRDYQMAPYTGYLDSEETYFPISVQDQRFPAKELMYVTPFNGASVALPYHRLEKNSQHSINVDGKTLTIEKKNNEMQAISEDKKYPGYFELWFSWAVHNQEDGLVLEL